MMLGMDMMGGGRRLPRNGLLIYLARPNSDEYLVGEDTEIGEDTYIWGYVLPDDADIRAATGWVNGAANVFYTATGVPIVALATEIAAAILPVNVVFSLVDATTQTGKLAIYTATTTEVTLAKARSVLRDESINRLFYEVDGIWYDPQDLTTMYQDAQGTLPVYQPGSGAVDPPMGLMFDKSLGLELGPELWSGELTVASAQGADGSYNSTTGEISVTVAGGDGTYPRFYMADPTIESNKLYRITISFSGYTDKFTKISCTRYTTLANFSTVGVILDAGTKAAGTATWHGMLPTGANLPVFTLFVDGRTTWSGLFIDSVSIREIKGYHAYQSTTTARPTLSGRYNLLTATETLSTQSVTTAATDYALKFEGAGTVTLSGTATGTYSAGTHTITCTAGTLTCTVAGTVMRADLRVKRDGSGLPAYQSVTNANTYDTAGFPLFLRRDKVNDDLIVQAPTITGQVVWGSIDTVDITTTTIAAGEYNPFGTITAGEPTCTQWIAIDGPLPAAEQAILERYVYSKSQLPVVPVLTIDTIPLTIDGQWISLSTSRIN